MSFHSCDSQNGEEGDNAPLHPFPAYFEAFPCLPELLTIPPSKKKSRHKGGSLPAYEEGSNSVTRNHRWVPSVLSAGTQHILPEQTPPCLLPWRAGESDCCGRPGN